MAACCIETMCASLPCLSVPYESLSDTLTVVMFGSAFIQYS